MIKWYNVPNEEEKLRETGFCLGAFNYIEGIRCVDSEGRFDMQATVAQADCELILKKLGASGLYSPGGGRGPQIFVCNRQEYTQQEIAAGHELGHHLVRTLTPERLRDDLGLFGIQREEEFCEYFAYQLVGVQLQQKADQLALFYDERPATCPVIQIHQEQLNLEEEMLMVARDAIQA